jgi:hypothetical protein
MDRAFLHFFETLACPTQQVYTEITVTSTSTRPAAASPRDHDEQSHAERCRGFNSGSSQVASPCRHREVMAHLLYGGVLARTIPYREPRADKATIMMAGEKKDLFNSLKSKLKISAGIVVVSAVYFACQLGAASHAKGTHRIRELGIFDKVKVLEVTPRSSVGRRPAGIWRPS